MSTPITGVAITGVGAALPREALTNKELIGRFSIDSDPQWIQQRTGIDSRHLAQPDETVVTLGSTAAIRALVDAGIEPPDSVYRLLLGSTTGEATYRPVPGAHPAIARRLTEAGYTVGASRGTNSACTSFVSALIDAYRHFSADGPTCNAVVVAGADVLSRVTDYTDRGTGILFADGAGAVVMERSDEESGVLGWHEMTDGALEDILYADPGEPIHMEGTKVFVKAVEAIGRVGTIALEEAGVQASDIKLVVPHQANVRIIDKAATKLGIPRESFAVSIDHHGNTSAASVPLALADALGKITDEVSGGDPRPERTKLHRGDRLLLVGFGAGMTAAAAVIQW